VPLPQKRWFRLAEVAKRWSMAVSDLEDYALDEMLQLATFVVDLPAEMGSWEGNGQRDCFSVQDLPILNGPQALLRSSLLAIFRDGQAEVRAFRYQQPNTYLHIRSDVAAIVVRRDDLIVTREERDRFECEHAATSAPDEPPAGTENWYSQDFSRVLLAGTWHKFGKKQAAVLRSLKAAGDRGERWCDGQKILNEVESSSMRLVDLFKYKPVWRQLIETDGNGGFRLNTAMLSPERRRVRLFRLSGPPRAVTRAAKAVSGRLPRAATSARA